ncbi:hypothetical protein [Borreliella garinii]|nr:hypothetical protein [Borreliella garinii]
MLFAKQQSFIGCELFEEKFNIIKEKSKFNKIEKRLPEINNKNCF